MATITQQPNEFGLAVGPNIWVIGTLGTANRFVLGVEIDGSLVATFKQTPNPAGVGIFDINQILQSYLHSQFVEITEKAAQTPGAALRYRIRYGSEIGTTIAWNGYSSYKVVFNGYKAFNQLNWPEFGQYIPSMETELCEIAGVDYTSCPLAEVKYLTSYPETRDYVDITGIPNKPVLIDDWQTLSFANFHQQSWTTLDAMNKAPWAVKIEYYNAAGTNYDTRAYTLSTPNGMPIRVDCEANTVAFTDDLLVGTIGTGPKNLQEASLWPVTQPAYYRVSLWTRSCGDVLDCDDISDIIDNSACLWAIQSYTLTADCSPFEPIQMSFMNEFGVRDYWTFTKRNTYSEGIQRNNYFRDAGTWSASSYAIESYERGTNTFNSTATVRMLVSTDWVTNEQAEWFSVLFSTPDAKIFYNDQWVAVTLTSTEYQQKTVARDNKVFRYELTLEFAQPKTIQRG